MFDIGWQELFVIGVVTVVVLGPKELPRAIRTVTGLVRKARLMAFEFQRGVDEMVRESELDELRQQAEDLVHKDIGAEVKRTIDPDGTLERDFANKAWEEDLDAMEAKRTIAPPPAGEAAEQAAPALPAPSETPLPDVLPPEHAVEPMPSDVPAPRRDQVNG